MWADPLNLIPFLLAGPISDDPDKRTWKTNGRDSLDDIPTGYVSPPFLQDNSTDPDYTAPALNRRSLSLARTMLILYILSVIIYSILILMASNEELSANIIIETIFGWVLILGVPAVVCCFISIASTSILGYILCGIGIALFYFVNEAIAEAV